MSNIFGWEAEDCCENDVYIDESTGETYINSEDDPDKYDDEDDEFLNSNDPLRKHRRPSLYEANPGKTIAVIGALLDENNGRYKKVPSDRFENGIKGNIEYVSMQEHLCSNSTAKRPPLRPFEQWVEDILDGKKTYDDPL